MMKTIAKVSMAAAALALSSAPAFAFDPASGGTGNGSLVVSVFDQQLGISVFQDLGLNYLDFQNSALSVDGSAATDVTPDSGLVLNFNVDLSIFGGNTSNLEYTVFAADGQGTFSGTEALVTANPTLGTFITTNGDVTSMYGSSGYANIIGQCANAGMNSVCTGTTAPPSGVYVGGTNWGDNFQYLNVEGSAAVGEALGFYGVRRSSIGSTADANVYQYANAAGAGLWSLDTNGNLSWTVAAVSQVPVPAAVWLLLSGLSGLGVIARRRNAV